MKNKIIIYIILSIVFLFMFIPLLWLFVASIDLEPIQGLRIPEHITFINFKKALSSRSAVWILNSLIIALSTSVLVVIVSILGAYPFSRLNFRGKNAILYGMVLLRIIPISTFMVPVYILFVKLRLINTYLSVIISLTVLGLPFAFLLMKGFYDTVPIVFEEAAWIDGCSRLKTIFTVIIPQLWPGIAVVWFMTFMFAWSEFQIPLILLRRINLMPLSVGIFTAYGEYGAVDYGFLSALSMLYSLPPVIMYIFIRKYMVKGMVGYVKG